MYKQVDEEYQQGKQEYEQLRRKVGSLSSNHEPFKVSQIFCRYVFLECDLANRSKAEGIQKKNYKMSFTAKFLHRDVLTTFFP